MMSRTRLPCALWPVLALCLTVLDTRADTAPAPDPATVLPTAATPAAVAVDSAGADNAKLFQTWLEDFRKEASLAGISQATLDATLTDLQPLDTVLERDQKQPEFLDTFLDYLNKRVSDRRLELGKEALGQQAAQLAEVERRYGIPARYLVAFWGLETNYGSHLGDTPVIAAMATLAFDARRPEFFRKQLLDALRIIDLGEVGAADLVGSWAGAIGHMQFIPSTYLAYAVDGDGDGRIDLRNSLPDALYSAANYLKQSGWQADEGWGMEVRLPAGLDLAQAGLDRHKPLNRWAQLGLLRADGTALPTGLQLASLLLPQGYDGPAFLVTNNFRVILRWNRSVNYAIAVGHLADRLAGGAPLSTGLQADNRRLSREQMETLQLYLDALGYAPGPADGVPGSRTRAAIRAFQMAVGLPPDGYPSMALLERLESTVLQQAQPVPGSTLPATTLGPA